MNLWPGKQHRMCLHPTYPFFRTSMPYSCSFRLLQFTIYNKAFAIYNIAFTIYSNLTQNKEIKIYNKGTVNN